MKNNQRLLINIIALALVGLHLFACGSLAPTPEPDLVATGVAVEKAVAATLTAEAPAPTATVLPASATEVAVVVAPSTNTPLPATATAPPPLPSHTPTLFPTPTAIPVPPSATPPSFVVLPPEGGGNDNLQGNIIFPGYTPAELDVNNLVFHDRLVFHVQVYDVNVGTADGSGIDNVDIRIFRNGIEVHQRTEQNAAYCVFGGGEPDCNVWVFADHHYQWPNGEPLENGEYDVSIDINPKQGQATNWNLTFKVEHP